MARSRILHSPLIPLPSSPAPPSLISSHLQQHPGRIFHLVPLTNKTGKFLWIALIPIYWAEAFCIAAGVPNFSGITSVVAAFCILQFIYIFPPTIAPYFWIRKAALVDGEGFDLTTARSVCHDAGLLFRGYLALLRKYLLLSTFNILYFLGALALAGLGAYSATTSLREDYQSGATSSFPCLSPLDD